MLREYEASIEYERISKLSAFNVRGAKRTRINQHAALYVFSDGSRMQINATTSRAHCWNPAWKGSRDDIHLGPLRGVPLRINRQGK